ncbi:MAG: hypothetical protein AAGK00_12360 [Pseudomonadota bacterium]
MDIVALDGTKLLALMAAGGIFALAGLWLIFRPKEEGDTAKIELFGLKFQSSSAGLLVFLIGAVFLALPIFVPEKAATGASVTGPQVATGEEQPGNPPTGGDQGVGTQSGQAEVSSTNPPTNPPGTQPVPVATGPLVAAEGEEIEENDTLATANVIPVGVSIRGKTTKDDDDFFTFTFPDGFKGELAVTLDGNLLKLEVWDELGTRIFPLRDAPFPDNTYRAEVSLSRYYVSVETWQNYDVPYTLNVAARAE